MRTSRTSKAATRSSTSPAPTSCAPSTRSTSRSASTAWRPTPSARTTPPLNEYEIADRIFELSESGARIAREVADEFAEKDGRQRWVLGSIGPGTKLPSLGHITYDVLRDGYQKNAEGLLAGGSDALIVETTQDLLQTKSASSAPAGPWTPSASTCR